MPHIFKIQINSDGTLYFSDYTWHTKVLRKIQNAQKTPSPHNTNSALRYGVDILKQQSDVIGTDASKIPTLHDYKDSCFLGKQRRLV